MIYILGDSHGYHNYKNNPIPNVINLYQSNITMHRIGRDNIIINFDRIQKRPDDIYVFCYGEIDCRCHIQQQINAGRNEDQIIEELVQKYFTTINNHTKPSKRIVITAVVPPVSRAIYEKYNGPITHEFPFVGTDEDRVRFTVKMNSIIADYCKLYDYYYFYPYEPYILEDGTLNFAMVENNNIHIDDNTHINTTLLRLFK
jgi:hypothetical protein